ncbi:CinA family nicotinamide mononucleotide deamidase-related protein [Longirhabdus pacifica]|uniref:CinA family nicotinamide mononucleotide deamidase-related protein n=1 Tax=Longirhabdus pacifica TaxID=2305227 RepID=UPI001008F3B5|nr:CinA family nicotinamide mononucleotide deamidase-related protein [Longirhabdus pacifica]
MRAEILCVGTELLLGQIVNTNAKYLSEQCSILGVDVYFQTVVGDNKQRIQDALHTAYSRADLVICTGGLGPTEDDMTADAAAAFFGTHVEFDKPALNKIEGFFKSRNIEMSDNNKKQAQIIHGSVTLHNEVGLAVGSAFQQHDKAIILLPGPPSELYPMFEHAAAPWIQKTLMPQNALSIYSTMLKFTGIGESKLEDTIKDLIAAQTDPTIAPYAKENEVSLRITTKADSREAAETKWRDTKREILTRLGAHFFTEGQDSLLETTVKELKQAHQRISVLEWGTGGSFTNLIAASAHHDEVLSHSMIIQSLYQLQTLFPNQTIPVEEEQISLRSISPIGRDVIEGSNVDLFIFIYSKKMSDTEKNKDVPNTFVSFIDKFGNEFEQHVLLYGNHEIRRVRAAKTALSLLWKFRKNIAEKRN